MNNALQLVIHLQELDRQIAALQEWIERLPHHLGEIEKQLSDIQSAYAAAQGRVSNNHAQRKQFQNDIQSMEQKISKYNDQLLDVKTNEEYRAFLHQIEFSRNEIKKIEDKILTLMIELEDDEKHLKSTEQELRRQQQAVGKEKEEAEVESRKKKEALEGLLLERQSVEQALGDSTLDLYHRIAKLRNGVVVAEARNQICTECHVLIRPQTYNEIMRNEGIIQCSNCSRILYWVTSASSEAPSGPPSGDAAHD